MARPRGCLGNVDLISPAASPASPIWGVLRSCSSTSFFLFPLTPDQSNGYLDTAWRVDWLILQDSGFFFLSISGSSLLSAHGASAHQRGCGFLLFVCLFYFLFSGISYFPPTFNSYRRSPRSLRRGGLPSAPSHRPTLSPAPDTCAGQSVSRHRICALETFLLLLESAGPGLREDVVVTEEWPGPARPGHAESVVGAIKNARGSARWGLPCLQLGFLSPISSSLSGHRTYPSGPREGIPALGRAASPTRLHCPLRVKLQRAAGWASGTHAAVTRTKAHEAGQPALWAHRPQGRLRWPPALHAGLTPLGARGFPSFGLSF